MQNVYQAQEDEKPMADRHSTHYAFPPLEKIALSSHEQERVSLPHSWQ